MIVCLFSKLALAAAPADTPPPITLKNSFLEVIVDPVQFAITSVKLQGGTNFLGSGESCELVSDLLPLGGAAARGPAEALETDDRSLVMVGPSAGPSGVRTKVEIQVHENEPSVLYRVGVIHQHDDVLQIAVRNTAKLSGRCTLRLVREGVTILPLAGTKEIVPAVVRSRKFWLIPVPPTAELSGVVLGARTPEVTQQSDQGTWTRRIRPEPAADDLVDSDVSFLCLLDRASGRYASVLQGGFVEIRKGETLVMEETWTFDRRGR